MQAEQRGVTLSRVLGYRAWQAMGRQAVRGSRSLAVLAPLRRRLSAEEAEAAPAAIWAWGDALTCPEVVTCRRDGESLPVLRAGGMP